MGDGESRLPPYSGACPVQLECIRGLLISDSTWLAKNLALCIFGNALTFPQKSLFVKLASFRRVPHKLTKLNCNEPSEDQMNGEHVSLWRTTPQKASGPLFRTRYTPNHLSSSKYRLVDHGSAGQELCPTSPYLSEPSKIRWLYSNFPSHWAKLSLEPLVFVGSNSLLTIFRNDISQQIESTGRHRVSLIIHTSLAASLDFNSSSLANNLFISGSIELADKWKIENHEFALLMWNILSIVSMSDSSFIRSIFVGDSIHTCFFIYRWLFINFLNY